jgi:hypothetical protein
VVGQPPLGLPRAGTGLLRAIKTEHEYEEEVALQFFHRPRTRSLNVVGERDGKAELFLGGWRRGAGPRGNPRRWWGEAPPEPGLWALIMWGDVADEGHAGRPGSGRASPYPELRPTCAEASRAHPPTSLIEEIRIVSSRSGSAPATGQNQDQCLCKDIQSARRPASRHSNIQPPFLQ